MEDPIKPEQTPEPAEKLIWLFTVNIVYNVENGLERHRPVNVIVKTFNPYISETVLGNVQQSAQIQAMEYKKIPRKAKILDAIITSFNLLGQMTDEQFHKKVTPEAAPSEQG
ncbi:hypothetical protein Ab1vBOLIVR2_gp73 [Agrobacterium phage OLIVR2]|uniref:Uncharacterized protein n=1 Tax=Agrobacterium phage OLIVR1 TaxID=2723769 RepID=A0A858MRU1_9CAUD|nr:hypothetical protein [Xanthomonas campestris]YP_010107107.1 hypothetical protein KNU98_gp036 [Agrobacterium phage OLIVR1]QIW87376.1 hypothetical protein Ab1vBOLIVR2_gp73 [Agrobacterium phage OLIVR2]QIW87483.1 hypothetical protein Ab1vBOLIVR3_gp73 [Agrobacterium phage OLIVR3]MCF8861655.1 hypothetical protein [Xanthomonas campestris pv. campestris]QIW87268.1 hypothetical protein Ab1vBOLIVR1_gp73 [Agrobacterium phage OLIVR1]